MNLEELVKNCRLRKENKELINEFPFLLPHNRFTDEVPTDYDYSFTELDAMPTGWKKSFGLDMCKEIKEELVKFNCLETYRITQIKEKNGTLHWYDNGHPVDSNLSKIIDKYEDLSMCYCLNCGKPVRYVTKGYEEFICEDCRQYYIDNLHRTVNSFIKINEDYIPHRTIHYPDGTIENIETDVDFKKYWGLK